MPCPAVFVFLSFTQPLCQLYLPGRDRDVEERILHRRKLQY
jgi:hypothetical protein